MIELPVSAQAIQHFQRLFDAAANGATLRCIEQEGGSKIYYVKQPLRSDQNFLRQILHGTPGPGRSSTVLKLVVHDAGRPSARQHLDAELPDLLSSASAETLKQRSQA
jgi:hypothetical protein